jgi:peptide/nickel transport system permease protein
MSNVIESVPTEAAAPSVPRARRRQGGKWELICGTVLLAAVVVMSIVIPMLAANGPNVISAAPFLPPSWSHPFGTDDVGRDVFVRTFAGGRIDLLAATGTVLFSFIVGTVIGTAAGFSKHRWADAVVMRIVDAIIAFPFVILILALVVVVGAQRQIGPIPAGLPATLAAFAVAGWVYYARLARGQALLLRNADFIVAARVLGFGRARIIFRHLLPSIIRVTLSYAVLNVIAFIIVISSLSFLGASVQPPTPEWGAIMYEGRAYLQTAWWITVLPGVVLVVTGVAMSLLGDYLLSDRSRRS